jgi:hypothetical protein
MRSEDYDAPWVAKLAFWLGVALISLGFILAKEGAGSYLSVTTWILGAMSLTGSAIIRLWCWKVDRDHDARTLIRPRPKPRNKIIQPPEPWPDPPPQPTAEILAGRRDEEVKTDE